MFGPPPAGRPRFVEAVGAANHLIRKGRGVEEVEIEPLREPLERGDAAHAVALGIEAR